jgi:hypothetical protein
MTFTLDVQWIFSVVGTAVCAITPLVIGLALYANFGVYRKGGDKWTGE